jgi:phenylpyruvate tautomerase PptA (4-oxalocrotonate tautomerase family)
LIQKILIFRTTVSWHAAPVKTKNKEASMPFARISLLKGKSPDYLRALSDGIHQAMVETFNVPPADRFQIIHQHEPDELIFDRNYLASPRSDDFVLISITTGKPRTTEMRKALFRRTVELLQQSPGLRPEDVMIVISTSEPDEWSFGDGLAQMAEPGWEAGARGVPA